MPANIGADAGGGTRSVYKDAKGGLMPETGRGQAVLLADESEGYRFMMKRAIQAGAPALQVVGEAGSGEEVMAYLSGQGPYAQREFFPFPDLLVMNTRLPGKNGVEVLEWLRTTGFYRLKVAILSDCSGVSLRERALELGACAFALKPEHGEHLVEVFQSLQQQLEREKKPKVLLQHLVSRCYFQADFRWTPLASEGLDFGSVEHASQFAGENQLTGVAQIALALPENGQTFYFPFPEKRGA